MTQYGYYTDESGNNGFGDMRNQPVLCYAGILVPHDKQVKLNLTVASEISKMKSLIKNSIAGIPQKEFEKINFFKDFELHGKAFIDGEDFYYNLNAEERFNIARTILNLVQDPDVLIIASVIDKKLYQTNTKQTDHHKMHILGYTELIRCINNELDKTNSSAFVIADDGKTSEINNFTQALHNPSNKRVYPDLQLKLSHDHACKLIQVADLITFITSVYYRDKFGHPARKRHHAEILRLFTDCVQNKIITWEYK